MLAFWWKRQLRFGEVTLAAPGPVWGGRDIALRWDQVSTIPGSKFFPRSPAVVSPLGDSSASGTSHLLSLAAWQAVLSFTKVSHYFSSCVTYRIWPRDVLALAYLGAKFWLEANYCLFVMICCPVICKLCCFPGHVTSLEAGLFAFKLSVNTDLSLKSSGGKNNWDHTHGPSRSKGWPLGIPSTTRPLTG